MFESMAVSAMYYADALMREKARLQMTEPKIKVPEGMLAAVDEAIGKARARSVERLASRAGELWPNDLKQVTLEAALRWLAQNPIVPTLDEWEDCFRAIPDESYPSSVEVEIAQCAEWQRRMFFVSEPEVPEAIKDLLRGNKGTYMKDPNREHDDAVIEAFHRGRQSIQSKQEPS